jgi:cutinase
VGRKSIAVAIGALGTATLMQAAPMPFARADGCPDAEVIFARGTTEDPGVGPTGQAFVDGLRARVAPKFVGVYAVDYPATTQFSTAVSGISDARNHILATAATCPKTKMVLGGFSQGAAVMGFVTASVVPDGVSAADVPAPMPPEIADHVAAVTLFGKPSPRFMKAINDPSVVVGPQYAGKSIELCVDNDLVCDPHGSSFSVHNQYQELGMVDQGATFAATQLQAGWAADLAAAAATPPATPGSAAPAAPSVQAALTPATQATGPTPHLPAAPLTPPGPVAPVAPAPPATGPLA